MIFKGLIFLRAVLILFKITGGGGKTTDIQ